MHLDVCCNDPDNGNFAGVAPQLQIGAAEFEANSWNGVSVSGPKFTPTSDGFKISSKHFKTTSSKEWWGNWCWNRYWMKKSQLIDFALWMHHRYNYSCTTGTVEFYNWFNCAEMATREQVGQMLQELMEQD